MEWIWNDNYLANYSNMNTTKLTKSAEKIKRRTYISLKDFFQVNDIFMEVNHSHNKYYIKKFISYDRDGGKKFQIARVDGNSIVDVDLNILIKDAKIEKRGYLYNQKTCTTTCPA